METGFRIWLEAIERRAVADLGMNARVEYGKTAEAGVVAALRSAGWEVTPASAGADMFDKIDAWVHIAGATLPLQIKYREAHPTQDRSDILLEVMKNWTEGRFASGVPLVMDGRDMVGRSVLYACLDPAGQVVRVRLASEAKSAAESMVRKLKDEFRKNGLRSTQTPRGEARITVDPHTGVGKVMAFIHPGALTKALPGGLQRDVKVAGGSMYAA